MGGGGYQEGLLRVEGRRTAALSKVLASDAMEEDGEATVVQLVPALQTLYQPFVRLWWGGGGGGRMSNGFGSRNSNGGGGGGG